MSEVGDGSIVVARAGTGSWFHRATQNGKGLLLESLLPGGEATLVQDPSHLYLLGRVTAFYRRMDDAPEALNLTAH